MKNSSLVKVILVAVVVIVLALLGFTYYIYNQAQNGPVDAALAPALQQNNQGNLDGAISAAQQVTAAKPNDVQALLVLAFSYLDKGSESFMENEYAAKAIAVANQILTIDSKNSEAYRVLGSAYEIEQMYPQALQNYSTAISLDSKNELAYANRGHAYDLMGNITAAKKDYDTAYALNPNDDFNLMNLARYYYTIGNASSTIQFAEATINASSKTRIISTAYDLIGLTYTNDNNLAAAVPALDSAITSDPSYFSPYLDRAYLHFLQNTVSTSTPTADQIAAINVDINQALTIYPESANAYVLKALVAQSQNDTADVKADTEKELALLDTDITLSADQKQAMLTNANQVLAGN